MNLRTLILLSVAGNLVLGAALWHGRSQTAATVPVPVVAQVAPVPAAPAPVVEPTVDVAEQFNWAQLASEDFKRYRDNLLAIGCPEDTVRVIITAEINDQFRRRRRALMEEFQRTFWDRLARHELKNQSAYEKPLEKLNEEREHLLEQVLPREKALPEDIAAARTNRQQRAELRLAWLPAEKRQQLFTLEEKARDQRNALQKEIEARPDSKETEADTQRRKYIDEELANARKGLLTVEEMAEFELRNSKSARWARDLNGFEVSEAEWRAGAKVMQDYEKAYAAKLDPVTGLALKPQPGQSPEEFSKQAEEVTKQMEAAREEQLQAALGADRYAQLQLAKNDDYQQTRRITARYHLPDSLAQEVAAVQQQAELTATLIRQDKSLAFEARAAAVADIEAETRRTLQQKLTGDIWTTYLRYHGNWLKQMRPEKE